MASRLRRFALPMMGLALCLFVVPHQVFASPPSAGETKRVRGIINRDETWSGHVLITDDLSIEGATVKVDPGTTIEFAQAAKGSYPVLTIGNAAGMGGQLKLLGTAAAPIVVGTVKDTNAGQIDCFVGAAKSALRRDPKENVAAIVSWQHVQFRGLGHAAAEQDAPSANREAPRRMTRMHPAVSFHASGAACGVSLVNCTFEHCTRVSVESRDSARLTVVESEFRDSADSANLQIVAGDKSAAAPLAITRSRFDAAAQALGAVTASLSDNLMIGINASIILGSRATAESKIVGNFVHHTDRNDDGGYCLKCESPDVLIKDNCLRGGTTCVLSGSRRMQGNVLIAEGRLQSKVVKSARTHYLVESLPAGSVFEDNVLLGPAHTMIVPQPRVEESVAAGREKTMIRHNVFDGYGESGRAICFNPMTSHAAEVVIHSNLFVRFSTLAINEGGAGNGILRYWDHNAIAPQPSKDFERLRVTDNKQGAAGWGAKDIRAIRTFDLHLAAELPDKPPDFDADVAARKMTIAQARERYRSGFRLRENSPLLHAGLAEADATSSVAPPIGLSPVP